MESQLCLCLEACCCTCMCFFSEVLCFWFSLKKFHNSDLYMAFSFFKDDLGFFCSESIRCDLRRYLHTTWYCCSVVDVLELKWGETYIAPHQMDWLAHAWVTRYPWASTNCNLMNMVIWLPQILSLQLSKLCRALSTCHSGFLPWFWCSTFCVYYSS